MKAGASGYLTKAGASLELIAAVRTVLSGKRYINAEAASALASAVESGNGQKNIDVLSEREKEVFTELAKGQTVSEIAHKLNLSTNTISTFRSRIFEKLGFHNNLELIKYAIENRLLE
jgi:DNA-binding NarL/FixJ family response regulator